MLLENDVQDLPCKVCDIEYKTNRMKPTALWSLYSLLKGILNVKQNIKIKKYSKFVPYLKNKCVGQRPKESKALTKTEIDEW